MALAGRAILSDAELEAALLDRLSFKRFVGLGLEDDVPDHTTLCRFRNLLIEQVLLERLGQGRQAAPDAPAQQAPPQAAAQSAAWA